MSIRLPRRGGFLPAVLCLVGLVAPAVAQQSSPAQKCPRPTKGALVTTTYAVADLIIPVDREPRRIAVGPSKAERIAPEKSSPSPTREELLIKLIVDTIQPRSWNGHGGPGTIDYFPLTMSLVINQTPDIQDQVDDLLAALRRLQDQEVAVEVRFITIAEDFFEHIGVELMGGLGGGLKALDDAHLRCLMEAVQGDRRSNVMQAPKLTLFNGQRSTLCVGEEKPFVTGLDVRLQDGHPVFLPKTETIASGLELSLQPVISADRRSVRVDLQAALRDVDASVPLIPVSLPIQPVGGDPDGQPVVFTQYLQQPRTKKLSVEKTFTVADGRTMVVDGGKRTRLVRNEYGPPVLSDLPLVGRLFRNVAYGEEPERVLVLVTPRIIIGQEEEERSKPAVPNAAKSPVEEIIKHFKAAYKQGKYEEAEKWALMAQELDPDNSPAQEFVLAHCPQTKSGEKKLAALLAKYQKACTDGRLDAARELAARALAIDPACFSKPRP
jgi:type II secretory pathway component GspD/PulD (secretin)